MGKWKTKTEIKGGACTYGTAEAYGYADENGEIHPEKVPFFKKLYADGFRAYKKHFKRLVECGQATKEEWPDFEKSWKEDPDCDWDQIVVVLSLKEPNGDNDYWVMEYREPGDGSIKNIMWRWCDEDKWYGGGNVDLKADRWLRQEGKTVYGWIEIQTC